MAPKRSDVTPARTISRFFAPKQPKTESDSSPPAVISAGSSPLPAVIASAAQSAPPSQVVVQLQTTQVESKELTKRAAHAEIPTPPAVTHLAARAAKTGGSLSELQLGSQKIPLLCTRDADLANDWAQDVQRSINAGLSTDVASVMGVDCEWAASWFRPGCPERLATLQLCHHGIGGLRVLVLHLLGFEGKLPEAVASLLADTRIAKVGAGVGGDARRLVRDLSCVVRGLYDLGRMDAGKKAVSLEDMVREHCPSELHIKKAAAIGEKGVRTGNWEAWPLSAQQIDYAARDAALSVLAFVHRFSMAGKNTLSETAREALTDLTHAEVEEVASAPMASKDASAVAASEAKAEPKAKAKAKSKKVDKETAEGAAVPIAKREAGEANANKKGAAGGGAEDTDAPEASAAGATPSPKKRKADGGAKTAKKKAKKQEEGDEGAAEEEDDATEGDAKQQKRVLTDEQKAHFFQCMRNKAISPPNIGVKEHPKGAKDALSKVVVIVSGILDSFERNDFEQYVLDHGGKVSKGVTAKVTHLVNDHGEAGPSKQAKCKEFGIPVVSEDVILKMVTDSLSAAGGV